MTMAPDERAVRADLRSARFQLGVDGGRWRLLSLDWPVGLFAVAAAERAGSPVEYALRVDFSGYPQRGPHRDSVGCRLQRAAQCRQAAKGYRAGRVFRCNWTTARRSTPLGIELLWRDTPTGRTTT